MAPLVPAVKPQSAFFEELGPDGCLALSRVIRYARAQGLIVICDAKRGDIGTTAEAYARAYLAGSDPRSAPWQADALTVNPYMGTDTLEPFVRIAQERGAGIYVLVKTSNPGKLAAFHRTGSRRERPSTSTSLTPLKTCHAKPRKTDLGSWVRSLERPIRVSWPICERSCRMFLCWYPGTAVRGRRRRCGRRVRCRRSGCCRQQLARNQLRLQDKSVRGTVRTNTMEAAAEAATKQMIADLAKHTAAGKLT